MAELPSVDVRLEWKPFLLVPKGSLRGTPSKLEFYSGYFGPGSEAKVRGYWRRLREEGAALDIDFEFEGRVGDTFDAHRLAEWARATSEKQDALVQAQFAEYMEGGHPPSDRASLLRAAGDVGLDLDEAAAVLDDPAAYADDVHGHLRAAATRGVTGVPAFFLEDELITTGAIPVEHWIAVLSKIIASKQKQQATTTAPPTVHGASCSDSDDAAS